MVHGRRDRTILPAQAERLFAAADEPKLDDVPGSEKPPGAEGTAVTTTRRSWEDIVVVPRKRFLKAMRLELAPFTKVIYSSDAFGSPELQWLAGKKGREGLTAALAAAIDAGNLSAEAARHAARLILADNVRLIYDI